MVEEEMATTKARIIEVITEADAIIATTEETGLGEDEAITEEDGIIITIAMIIIIRIIIIITTETKITINIRE